MKPKKNVSTLVNNPHRVSSSLKIPAEQGPKNKPKATPRATPKAQNQPKITRKPHRIAGLDALRGFAVGIVMAYHFFPQAVPGGFIGVDVFFVISGFLITSLLLREYQVHQTISLKGFWKRRARRLLPALGIMVATCIIIAGIIGRDATVGLPAQVFGAATFSSNWVYVAQGTSYSAALTPALFANLWSLAVEEQFYLLWPLLVVAGLVLGAKYQRITPRVLTIATGLIVVASATAMALMFEPGVDPSRIYFGTDTHLFGIMLGALLAMLRRPNRTGHWPRIISGQGAVSKARNKLVTLTLGVVSSATLVVAALWLEFDSAWTYQGGLVLVSMASAGLITAILSGQQAAARLETVGFKWIGQRSYGLYLWHWPVLLLTAYVLQHRDVGTNVGAWTAIIALIVIFAASWSSYKYVELPIMRHGFRNYWATMRNGLLAVKYGGTKGRLRVISVTALLALALVFVIGVLATSPKQSSIEQDIALGQAALREDSNWSLGSQLVHGLRLPGIPQDPAAKGTGATDPEAVPAPATEDPAVAEPEPEPEPVAPTGDRVTVIGDSVTLASVAGLKEALPGVTIDAETSRGVEEAVKIMAALEKKGKLKEYVVVALATNGLVTESDLKSITEAAGDRELVLVTAHGERSWIPPGNETLKGALKQYDNVTIADWDQVISGHSQELARDGIHPSKKAGERFANEIKRALLQASIS